MEKNVLGATLCFAIIFICMELMVATFAVYTMVINSFDCIPIYAAMSYIALTQFTQALLIFLQTFYDFNKTKLGGVWMALASGTTPFIYYLCSSCEVGEDSNIALSLLLAQAFYGSIMCSCTVCSSFEVKYSVAGTDDYPIEFDKGVINHEEVRLDDA